MLYLVSSAVSTGDPGRKTSGPEDAGRTLPAAPRTVLLGVTTTGSILLRLPRVLCPAEFEFNVEDADAGERLPCHSTCALIDGVVP